MVELVIRKGDHRGPFEIQLEQRGNRIFFGLQKIPGSAVPFNMEEFIYAA